MKEYTKQKVKKVKAELALLQLLKDKASESSSSSAAKQEEAKGGAAAAGSGIIQKAGVENIIQKKYPGQNLRAFIRFEKLELESGSEKKSDNFLELLL